MNTQPGYIKSEKSLAGWLGISERSVRGLMKSGTLPYHRVSHRLVLFRVSDVNKALDRFRVAGGAQ